MDTNHANEAAFLEREDGSTIAYHRSSGKHPGVVFLTGFKSDMTGSKAISLESYCQQRGQAFLRFDYTGHGQSSGLFVDGSIGQWANDAIDALDRLTEGPQILVGSSMGGWIMLLAALKRPERVRFGWNCRRTGFYRGLNVGKIYARSANINRQARIR